MCGFCGGGGGGGGGVAYGGHEIKQFGMCNLTVDHNGHKESSIFHVTDTQGPIILGLPTCRALGLVAVNYSLQSDHLQSMSRDNRAEKTFSMTMGDINAKKKILKEYGNVFEGIGCFEGAFHITVDPTVPPCSTPCETGTCHSPETPEGRAGFFGQERNTESCISANRLG